MGFLFCINNGRVFFRMLIFQILTHIFPLTYSPVTTNSYLSCHICWRVECGVVILKCRSATWEVGCGTQLWCQHLELSQGARKRGRPALPPIQTPHLSAAAAHRAVFSHNDYSLSSAREDDSVGRSSNRSHGHRTSPWATSRMGSIMGSCFCSLWEPPEWGWGLKSTPTESWFIGFLADFSH